MDFNKIANESYKAYTTEFDVVLEAEDICDTRDHAWFKQALEKPYRLPFDQTTKERLQSLEEAAAQIHTKIKENLASLTLDPSETSIGILIDTSGSDKALAYDYARVMPVLCAAYESQGFNVAVVGHTTTSWKGGETTKMWLKDGRPENPGRLCDLKISIYKDFGQAVTDNGHRLAALSDRDQYKENVDGEALAWMAEYLTENGRDNKVMIYISGDGVPVDDATLSQNPKDYLDRHARAVIDELCTSEHITFSAIHTRRAGEREFSRPVSDVFVKTEHEDEAALLNRVSEIIAFNLHVAAANNANQPSP